MRLPIPSLSSLLTTLLLGASLGLTACPRRVPDPTPGPGAASPEAELSALLATERALRLEQGELLWALWVRGEPGGVGEVYERYPGLCSPETFDRLEALQGALPGQQSQIEALSRSILAAHLARATAEVDARIARLQATATLEVEGMILPWRELGPRLARESDARRREQLRKAARPVQERHELLLRERRAASEAAAATLGLTRPAARDRLLPAPRAELTALARRILDREEPAFRAALEELARGRTGKSPAELPASAIGRLFAPEPGEEISLPPERLLEDLELLLAHPALGGATLGGAASTLAAGEDSRQAPLPLCLPVDPPGDLRLALAPRAGLRARLDALRETVICAELSRRDPGSSAGLAETSARLHRASARAHTAEHALLDALGAGSISLPELPGRQAALLATRQRLRLEAGARREAALLLSILEPAPEGQGPLAHQKTLLDRALGVLPAPEETQRWERAWAEAHLPTLAARVLAVARAHGLEGEAPVRPLAARRQELSSSFDSHGSLKE